MTGRKKVTYNIGNLKALEIRKTEIQSGNIDNSGIPFMYINGTSLADITSVNILNNYIGRHTDYLKFDISEKYINTNIFRKIETLPGDVNFESHLLNLKNNYYNGFNDWDRLNLMHFFLNYEHIKKYLSSPYILPTQFSNFYAIDKATPTNIEDYARRNRGGGKHLLANECRIRIPGPRPIYKDIPKCLAAQRNYINNLLSSSNSLDALAEMAIQGLGTRNVNFLKARPDLKQKVINYFKANDFSKSSHDGINWLLNRFQDTNNLPLDANLLRSASTPLFQDVGNPDRALQITFNQQAITEGITNFGNVLAELLKDNINIEFEGSVIRAFFVANGLNISDNVTNAWLGNIFKFVNNNGSFLRIDFENIEFRNEFLEIRNEIPLAKLERFIELKNLIERNPWALVEDCARENGLDIANYQQLYNHTLPQSCINRLNNLGSNFQNQPLNTGNAAVANVDYYGVEVTKRPDFNLDGRPDTDAEVYQKYREDFGELASGGKDNFQFSCDVPNNSADTGDITWEFSPYFSQDLTTWNSSNPLTTIFKIEAGANMLGVFDWLTDLSEDDGAIMISAYTPNHWIGSTIATEFSGTQPFSGNRQWGWLINKNNKLELFARAVDIARVSTFTRFNLLAGSPSAECKEDTYYNIGEETWSNLQNEIKQWINDNGGQAEIIPKTAIRFDKTKLKELLESNETIDEINCN